MIVAITIILILTVIVVATLPTFNNYQKTLKGAEQLQGWLFLSKQRALRDQTPNGVRLITANIDVTCTTSVAAGSTVVSPAPVNGVKVPEGIPWCIQPNCLLVVDATGAMPEPVKVTTATLNPPSFTVLTPFANPHTAPFIIRLVYATQLECIVQPTDFTGGVANIDTTISTVPGFTKFVTITTAPPSSGGVPGPDLAGGFDTTGMGINPTLWPVQPGDYLEINSLPPVYQIAGVSSKSQTTFTPPMTTANQIMTLNFNIPNTGPPPAMPYRVVRAPRVLTGESVMQLPQDVAIDVLTSLFTPDTIPTSPVQTNYDILFSPAGPLLRSGATTGKFALWVRDGTRDPGSPGEEFLVTVYSRTGLIASHPVDAVPGLAGGGDPYSFIKDGKSSGL
jgi:type II secretory pathway pseudopilin PulG